LFEGGIVHTFWHSAIAFATGKAPVAMGSAHPLYGPYQAFATADGWITVGAANQNNWLKLIHVLNADHLQDDPRFADNVARMDNLAVLQEALDPLFRARTSVEWLRDLEAAGVPAGPILDITQMHADPQARARDMVAEAPHTRLGRMLTVGHPVKYSDTPAGIERGAPLYGEHTREVLEEHGYSTSDIESLIRTGAVVANDG
jgi:crotonobetainyl-CoA:carnitine CoA-transferase CaiB-like acyl-CoA transferase